MNTSQLNNSAKETGTIATIPFTTGQVRSADGTTIGYHQTGIGPGLVILHGGGRASHHYIRLAQDLASYFRVTIPDRRGRGLSGPAGDAYSLTKETEDVSAVLRETGSRYLFGHSAGGVFALEAALKLPVDQLILYEPAVSINGSMPLDWLDDCEKALARKNYSAAMVIFFRGLHLNWISSLPYWVLYPMMAGMLRDEYGREMVDLLPTLIREAKAFPQQNLNYQKYHAILANTLLLGGSKSPAYLRDVLPVLANTIPQASFKLLPGLDHNAPDQNAPEIVADQVKQFLFQEKLLS
jgi:pimeloyl-ACP methyl ester carboxylesterase